MASDHIKFRFGSMSENCQSGGSTWGSDLQGKVCVSVLIFKSVTPQTYWNKFNYVYKEDYPTMIRIYVDMHANASVDMQQA